MADLSDVLKAYAITAANTLYPTPPGSASTPSPAAGIVVSIAVGWPSPQSLDDVIAAGGAMLTVFPALGMERNTTRYPQTEQVGALNPATLTLSLSGSQITVGGSPAGYAQNVGMFIDGVPRLASIPANDTPTQAAALLAAAFAGATSSGPVITIPGGHRIGPLRTGGTAATQKEVRRQERLVQVIAWAPSPDARDAVIQPVDLALAEVPFLTAADGSSIRSIYQRTTLIDNDQKQGFFRRDLFYLCEYPTLQTGVAAQVVAFETIRIVTDAAGTAITSPATTFA